jgi:hypothetical protein
MPNGLGLANMVGEMDGYGFRFFVDSTLRGRSDEFSTISGKSFVSKPRVRGLDRDERALTLTTHTVLLAICEIVAVMSIIRYGRE